MLGYRRCWYVFRSCFRRLYSLGFQPYISVHSFTRCSIDIFHSTPSPPQPTTWLGCVLFYGIGLSFEMIKKRCTRSPGATREVAPNDRATHQERIRGLREPR